MNLKNEIYIFSFFCSRGPAHRVLSSRFPRWEHRLIKSVDAFNCNYQTMTLIRLIRINTVRRISFKIRYGKYGICPYSNKYAYSEKSDPYLSNYGYLW